MKYLVPFNIWDMPVELLSYVQPGQWIYAGDKSTKGRFLGVKKNGIIVVAWRHKNLKIARAFAKA